MVYRFIPDAYVYDTLNVTTEMRIQKEGSETAAVLDF